MWWRRSSTRTSRPSSLAHRSAMVSPKNPEPTTTRSGLDKVETPDRVVARQSSEGQGSNRESSPAREVLHEPDHAAWKRVRCGPTREGDRDVRQCRGGVREEAGPRGGASASG